MLPQRTQFDPTSNPGATGRAAELRTSALIGRMILQASASLPLMAREPMLRALECEAEHLVVVDEAAAERALAALQDLRERLTRAMQEAHMSQQICGALVRAAEGLANDAS